MTPKQKIVADKYGGGSLLRALAALLEQEDGDVRAVARVAGVHYRSIYNWMTANHVGYHRGQAVIYIPVDWLVFAYSEEYVDEMHDDMCDWTKTED